MPPAPASARREGVERLQYLWRTPHLVSLLVGELDKHCRIHERLQGSIGIRRRYASLVSHEPHVDDGVTQEKVCDLPGIRAPSCSDTLAPVATDGTQVLDQPTPVGERGEGRCRQPFDDGDW